MANLVANGQTIKRKSSPKVEFLKRAKIDKNEKITSGNLLPSSTSKTPKRMVTSSPTISTGFLTKKNNNEPNLKFLACKLCNNKYDSFKHLPVIIAECSDTCCDYCARKLVKNNKFLCPLCKEEHVVPESKLYPLNKILLELLNIKLEKGFERTSIEKMKHNLNDLNSKMESLEKIFEESKEDFGDRMAKFKFKLSENYNSLVKTVKEKQEIYLNEMNNEIFKFESKFNQQKSQLTSEVSTLKSSSETKNVTLESKELLKKCNNLELFLQNEIDQIKKKINLKMEQKSFMKSMVAIFNTSNKVINLNFENKSSVVKNTVYAIDDSKAFYCFKEKQILIIRVFDMNSNLVLDELKLNSDSELKYARCDRDQFFVYFQSSSEFFLIRYDGKFNKPKKLSSQRELIFMNNDEIMLFSNKKDKDFIKVLDQDLNSLQSFGQCVNQSMPFFFKNKTFNIIGASKEKIIIRYNLDKSLKIFSRPKGTIVNEIELNNNNFDENDYKNIKLMFTNPSEFKIIIISKLKMKLKVLNESGKVLKEENLQVKPNFYKFSITNDDLVAFYYENSIQFLQI